MRCSLILTDRRGSGVVAVFAGLLAGSLALAQPQRLTFEVSSVKRSTSTSNNYGVRFSPGGLTADAPLRYVIQFAYHIRDFQLSGGPAWLESERYDISAKTDSKSTPDQILLMLQSLLEDRFGLKVHRGSEQRTALLMTPAKGGLKLSESAADCAALADQPPAKGKSQFQCGAWMASDDQFNGTKISMTTLGEWLSNQLGRPVVDNTGLTGLFDVHLHWSTDDQADVPNSAPAILAAMQEQLGIRIESGRGAVEILTIDHVARPDAN